MKKKIIRQGPLTTHMSEWRENASRPRSLKFPPLLLAKQVGILFLSEQKSRYVKCKLSCLLLYVFPNCLAKFDSFGFCYSISLKFSRLDLRAKIDQSEC